MAIAEKRHSGAKEVRLRHVRRSVHAVFPEMVQEAAHAWFDNNDDAFKGKGENVGENIAKGIAIGSEGHFRYARGDEQARQGGAVRVGHSLAIKSSDAKDW